MSVQPHTVTAFVTPPYNTFTLNCTASVRDTILVPKTFHWKVHFGGQEMNISSNGDRILITDINVNAPTSNSILRVTESISGAYQYICTAVLQFPGVEDDITGISSANVTVRGKTVSADCFCWGLSCLNHPLQASYLSMAYQHHSPWYISITVHGISASPNCYQHQHITCGNTLLNLLALMSDTLT